MDIYLFFHLQFLVQSLFIAPQYHVISSLSDENEKNGKESKSITHSTDGRTVEKLWCLMRAATTTTAEANQRSP